jgi:glycosyltransferase
MPHVAAVVGHGGFGTTLAALAAGAPQVVVPLFSFDQFDNAARVAEVGAGVALQDDGAGDRISAEVFRSGPSAVVHISDAVNLVLTDQTVRDVARDLADEIAALPATTDCVAALEQL